MDVNEVQGLPTELVHRFTSLLITDALSDDLRAELVFPIGEALGGRLWGIESESGQLPKGYIEELTERLAELVRVGVNESFLIRGVLQWIRCWLLALAPSEEVSNRRRARIVELLDDPEGLVRYRERLAESSPGVEVPSEEEVAETLRRTLAPVPPNVTALLAAWDRAVEEALPERMFDIWLDRYMWNTISRSGM